MNHLKKQNIESSLEVLKFNSGIYLLIIELDDDLKIRIGALGEIEFKKGIYCYVGSAQKNLIQRLKRHLRKDKKLHWHIDYLLRYAKVRRIYVAPLNKEYESIIANELMKYFDYILNFGNSDAKKDKSHLFFINKLIAEKDFNKPNPKYFSKIIKKFGFGVLLQY